MDMKKRAVFFVKSVLTWLGIYVILGCCIGFSIDILSDIFEFEFTIIEPNFIKFAVILIASALLLALISYFIKLLVKVKEETHEQTVLNKIFEENSITDKYITTLKGLCQGDRKHYNLIMLALTYMSIDEKAEAHETLKRIDEISMVDNARSSGDYIDAAYYYATRILLAISENDNNLVDISYKNGEFYMNSLDKDAYVMVALANYYLVKDDTLQATVAATKLMNGSFFTSKNLLLNGVAYYEFVELLYNLNFEDEAMKFYSEASKINISDNYDMRLRRVYKKIESKSEIL